MRKLFVCLSFLCVTPAWAFLDLPFFKDDTAAESMPQPEVIVPTTNMQAQIRLLDKRTNAVQTHNLALDVPLTHNSLTITMKNCVKETETQDEAAWLYIEDKEEPVFEGWMLSQYPEVATLNHPRYDVIFIGCRKS